MGLAARQIGIPADAVYIKYDKLPNAGSLFLIKPVLEPISDKKEFVLKLTKCPNSPISYNIGIFNVDFKIKASNSKDIILSKNNGILDFDPYLDFSSNLQRIVWASKGFLPGDPNGVPMNYINVCKVIDSRKDIQNQFSCKMHQTEVEKITEKFKNTGDLSEDRGNTTNFISNIIKLASQQNTEWITIPPINLFKKNAIKSLYIA